MTETTETTQDSEVQATTQDSGGAGQTQTTQAADDAYYRVPKEAVRDFEDGWHGVVREAKTGKELKMFAELAKEHGMTPKQLYDFIRQGEGEQDPTAGTGQAGRAQGASDEDRIRQLAEEAAEKKVTNFRKEEAEAHENERRQQYTRQAKQARQDIRTELLQKLKIKPDDHRADTIGDLAESCLRRTIAKGLESYEGLRGLDLFEESLKHPPKEEEKQAALEAALKRWTDLGNEFVSTAAGRQQGLPGSTLAGGAGGTGKPPKDFKGMTAQEKADWMVGQTD